MTAFAGFYITPDAWCTRMDSNLNRHPGAFGETAAQDLIREALRENKAEDYFYVQIVPVTPSEPDYRDDALAGRKVIKQYLGLEVSVWKTLWFNEESSEAPYEAEFLKPKRGKAKKPRNKTKDEVTAGRKRATGGEEGGDQVGKGGKEDEGEDEGEGAQVGDGKVEDQETKL